MADLENEGYEFVVLVALVAIVAIAVWLYLKAKNLNLGELIAEALQQMEKMVTSVFSAATGSESVSSITDSWGSGDGFSSSDGSSSYDWLNPANDNGIQVVTGTNEGV